MTVSEPSFLYIDDDPLSLEVIQILLEKMMGYSDVTYFKNSRNIVENINNLPKFPDVIFVDLKIRPQNGYEVLEMLKNLPIYESAKIIAVTASVMSDDVEKMKAAGFTGLISKPILHRIFPELVNKILAGEPVWYIS